MRQTAVLIVSRRHFSYAVAHILPRTIRVRRTLVSWVYESAIPYTPLRSLPWNMELGVRIYQWAVPVRIPLQVLVSRRRMFERVVGSVEIHRGCSKK